MKMKLLILLVTLATVLCSCASVPPAETDTKDTAESGTAVDTSGIDTEINSGHDIAVTEYVSYEYKYANMSLRVVDGWVHETVEYTDSSSPFGIKIYPEYKPEETITIMYYPDMFGVCGTGLTEEKTTLSGLPANKGFYDGSTIWNFIATDNYAIINNMSSGTYGLYQDDVELMIGSVDIAKGVITPDEAVEIASDKLIERFKSIQYTTTDFNYVSGIWEVTVYMDENYSIHGAKVYVSYLGTFIAEEIFAIVD